MCNGCKESGLDNSMKVMVMWCSLPHGTVTGRSVRRLARNLRIQPDLVGKIKSRAQDPVVSQAELLRVLPTSVPIRLSGE